MQSIELNHIGTDVFKAFERLLKLDNTRQFSIYHTLIHEEQRFRLWAHSLGLHHEGHSSLDYRVRDIVIIKDPLFQTMLKLQEHLDNLLTTIHGDRGLFEDDVGTGEDSDKSSTKSEVESRVGEQSHPNNQTDFHEVDFRIQSISDRVDALYSLAVMIRNPNNRQQLPNDQLYSHVPAESRASYIKEREEAEISTVAHAQRQRIIEMNSREDATSKASSEGLDIQYTLADNWLIRRTGIANARRRQHFIFWKDHALDLGKKPILIVSMAQRSSNEVRENDFMKAENAQSKISYHSGVSTAMSLKDEKLEWPAPPTNIASGQYFTCPYCNVSCPQGYLTEGAWRIHLIHDLQPYHCTYKDCRDHRRLYRSRQAWIDHESQHTLVWHCQAHGEEFGTQLEYTEHLGKSHPEATPEHFSPELISSVVGASLKLQRECPFCPTKLTSITEMEKHIAFHLEQCALLALLPIENTSKARDSFDHSFNSHVSQPRSHQGSFVVYQDNVNLFDPQDIPGDSTFINIGDNFGGKSALQMRLESMRKKD